MSSIRLRTLVLAPLLLALVLGCSSSTSPEPEAASKSSPTVAPSSAPPAPAPPRVGSCHSLSVTEATDPVDTEGSVPCGRRHTSVTVKVGQLDPVADGHLLAVDSRTVRAQIEDACPDTPGAFLGGSETAKRLSRFEVVWFSPSLEQADAGANWYRCDLVAVRSEGKLVPLPARVKGLLDQDGVLDRFGTCGTGTAPGKQGFARVVCSEPHRSRAIDVIDLPRDARFLAKDVFAKADSACKDIAADRADGALKYTWTFEWPTRAQWRAGQRYGYCWVPET